MTSAPKESSWKQPKFTSVLASRLLGSFPNTNLNQIIWITSPERYHCDNRLLGSACFLLLVRSRKSWRHQFCASQYAVCVTWRSSVKKNWALAEKFSRAHFLNENWCSRIYRSQPCSQVFMLVFRSTVFKLVVLWSPLWLGTHFLMRKVAASLISPCRQKSWLVVYVFVSASRQNQTAPFNQCSQNIWHPDVKRVLHCESCSFST